MKISALEGIHKAKIENRLLDLYRDDIQRLRQCGFGDLDFIREVGFPLSALVFGVWTYPLAWMNGDIVRITPALQIVFYYPLMTHAMYSTFVTLTRRGITFSTRFNSGLILQTPTRFDTQAVVQDERIQFARVAVPAENYPRRQRRHAPLTDTWHFHQKRVEDALARGDVLDTRLMLEDFNAITEIANRAILG